MEQIEILIVEDRAEIARRLGEQVRSVPNWSVCGMVGTLDQAINALFHHKPRLVLVDLGLPDGSGIELIQSVKEADWPCEALVISIFGDEKRVVDAIAAGASGYLLKGSSIADFTREIQATLDGGSPISPQIARHLLTLVKSQPKAIAQTNLKSDLTPREIEVLTMVAHGFKRREIGEKLFIATGTVSNHISNIYKKLEVSSNIDAVSQATRAGLI